MAFTASMQPEQRKAYSLGAPPLADADIAPESLLETAQHHFSQQDYVKALKAFTKVVECSPALELGYLGKVASLQHLRRPRGALKACQAALEFLLESESLLALRQELCLELGDEAHEICAPVKKPAAEELSDSEAYTDSESTAASEEDGGNMPAETDAPCPASKSQASVRREGLRLQAQAARTGPPEPDARGMASEGSASWRAAKKASMTACFRDLYHSTRSQSVDTSSYTKVEKRGLTNKEAHQHMPRPDDVQLPDDHRELVGTISPAELAAFGSENSRGRLLISLHGDIFDVSDRPDKYGPEGPYSGMAGHDITWPLWSGLDSEEETDKYFDLQRAASVEERDRRFQGLMSWWAFYEQEYGSPVGRLAVYDREWELPPPPKVEDLCTVM